MKNLARAFIEIRRASSRHVETEYDFLKFLSLLVDQEGEKKTLNAFCYFEENSTHMPLESSL